MHCSICIATYKRPELLEKLLISLSNQRISGNWETEIIIVDNDTQESARSVFQRFANNGQNLKYFTQPVKNISLTRNKAVNSARGDYIAFIDDDERADRDWLKNLAVTLKKYNADVVIGRILSEFPVGTPEWLKSAYIFNRPANQTGEKPYFTYTGNCFIKRSAIANFQGPFDVSYGLSGGGDTHLFTRIGKQGGKIVSCYEAVTYEYVPPERANVKWLVMRAFRTGNNFVRRKMETVHKYKAFLGIFYFLKGLLYSFANFIICFVFIFNKCKSLNYFLKGFAHIGKAIAVIGIHPREY